VPDGPEAIEGPWLARVLASSGLLAAGRSVTWEWSIIGADRGFTGRIALVRWRADGEGAPAGGPVVAKFPDAGQDWTRCEREVHFYRELAAEAGLAVPRFVHAETRPDEALIVLLLEHVDGVMVDILEGAGVDQVEAVVTALGAMHGRWWESRRLADTAWLPRWGGGTRGHAEPHQRRAARYRRRIAPFLERFGDAAAPGLAELIERLGPVLEAALAEMKALSPTLLHADLHLDNLVFGLGADAEPVVVLDWQSVSFGPGLYDLARFLTGSMPARVAADAMGQLCGRYREEVARAGGPRADQRRWERDFRRMMLVVLAGFVSGYGGRDPATMGRRERRLADQAASVDGMGGLLVELDLVADVREIEEAAGAW
jgi:Ser/Thr protein kinase RdoA (MazF antagonist)